jgi:hypothetical protein
MGRRIHSEPLSEELLTRERPRCIAANTVKMQAPTTIVGGLTR